MTLETPGCTSQILIDNSLKALRIFKADIVLWDVTKEFESHDVEKILIIRLSSFGENLVEFCVLKVKNNVFVCCEVNFSFLTGDLLDLGLKISYLSCDWSHFCKHIIKQPS